MFIRLATGIQSFLPNSRGQPSAFAVLVLKDEDEPGEKPFQKFQFLVRDWQFKTSYKHGAEDGKLYLDRILKISEDQKEEHRVVRNHIKACYETVDAFLMPHPGPKVATGENFCGKLEDIEDVAGGVALAVVAGVAVAALPESVAGSIARATVDVAKLAVAKLIR